MKKIQLPRREYGSNALTENDIFSDPWAQFETWFNEAIEKKILDPCAMLLATVDENGFPDARIVLMKEFDKKGIVFFTHYASPKALQAEKKGVVSLNFYWKELTRQVRIKGSITRITREESEAYFSSRPRESQLGTLASNQSEVIESRSILEKKVEELQNQYEGKEISCPKHWGGYRVSPFEFEFFQGRDNRLNDRIRYQKINDHWQIDRLSP